MGMTVEGFSSPSTSDSAQKHPHFFGNISE
jgi:hypothetical protein